MFDHLRTWERTSVFWKNELVLYILFLPVQRLSRSFGSFFLCLVSRFSVPSHTHVPSFLRLTVRSPFLSSFYQLTQL